jgi:hypothetical protein
MDTTTGIFIESDSPDKIMLIYKHNGEDIYRVSLGRVLRDYIEPDFQKINHDDPLCFFRGEYALTKLRISKAMEEELLRA